VKAALLACSTLLALAYGVLSPGWCDAGVSTALLAALKASGIVLLAMLALMHRSRLLAAALMFGAAGDALLALSRETFLLGAGAFLVGHLCYIALFTRAGIGLAALRDPARLGAIVALALAAIVSTSWLVPRDSPMFAPLGVYTGVLTLMAVSSFTLPWSRWLAMAGAVLFFVSDGFVAANLFHAPANATAAFWMNFGGWMIYWAGQAAICFGVLRLHESPPQ
jgi:uncharacterized membrane protein YhhN